jgi:hypothetical protein
MSLSPLSPNAILPTPLVGVPIVIPVLASSSIDNALANDGGVILLLPYKDVRQYHQHHHF